MTMHKLTQYLGALLLGCVLNGAVADPIDINSADAQVLADTMIGVGPAKADAIVAYRKENGPFKSVDDLALIKGIGEATLDKNRAKLTVAAPAK
jgi:competence protein ComEA